MSKFLVVVMLLGGSPAGEVAPDLPVLTGAQQEAILSAVIPVLEAGADDKTFNGSGYLVSLRRAVYSEEAVDGKNLTKDSAITLYVVWWEVERYSKKPLGIVLDKDQQLKIARVTRWIFEHWSEHVNERHATARLDLQDVYLVLAQGKTLSKAQQHVLLRCFRTAANISNWCLPEHFVTKDDGESGAEEIEFRKALLD